MLHNAKKKRKSESNDVFEVTSLFLLPEQLLGCDRSKAQMSCFVGMAVSGMQPGKDRAGCSPEQDYPWFLLKLPPPSFLLPGTV